MPQSTPLSIKRVRKRIVPNSVVANNRREKIGRDHSNLTQATDTEFKDGRLISENGGVEYDGLVPEQELSDEGKMTARGFNGVP
jgi:hypothetical protein